MDSLLDNLYLPYNYEKENFEESLAKHHGPSKFW